MSATIIDGKRAARDIRDGLRQRILGLSAIGVRPRLAIVMVGNAAASKGHVSSKIAACDEVGLNNEVHLFPSNADERSVIERIQSLNANPSIHGIMVQLPLPPHLDTCSVVEAISRPKDVDGFHLYNAGSLMVDGTVFPPCTPFAVQKLLEYQAIPLDGRNVVVVAANSIVAKPIAVMLLREDTTVSICHVRTRDLTRYTELADILVVAAGKPGLIEAQMVKSGAAVIDVGIHRLPDGRIVGDVDFERVSRKASFITPVPGGVGPVTVTMLLENTARAAERCAGAQSRDATVRRPLVTST